MGKSIYRLTDSIDKLSFIKPKTKSGLFSEGVQTVSDLLLYKPRRYDDKSKLARAYEIINQGDINTFVEVVGTSYFGPINKKILKITVKEICIQKFETHFIENTINLLCFNRNFMARYVKVGMKYYLTGTAVRKFTTVVDVSTFELHPILNATDFGFGKILPIYPLNASLTEKNVREAVEGTLLEYQNQIKNDLPDDIYKKYNLYDIKTAIKELHFPKTIESAERARRTLAFNELFILLLQKGSFGGREDDAVMPLYEFTNIEKRFIKSLPYTLTESQQTAIGEICSDLDAKFAMKRLLHGDVGSGKTMVALISALHEIEKGNQVAFMVPTELLAIQHYNNAVKFFSSSFVKVGLLKGGLKSKDREDILEKIKSKDIDLIIGTHSLISESAEYNSNLTYVIIDEEHRFGVEQREAFYNKSKGINVLTMSATPIPRSLAGAMCGSLNVSTLNEMPNGRTPIITHVVGPNKRKEMYACIKAEFERGHQAYFVSPRIDSTDESLRDVYDIEMELKEEYGDIPYGVIHSRVSEKDKLKILEDFANGTLKYIIATSVVEVGLDNPNATVMVIERADLFGIATLHQLRGRVGRSELQSWCFLVYSPPLSDEATIRLKAMKDSNDGFYLAEKDASVRGVGDLLGTKQSGESTMKFARLDKDADFLMTIRKEIITLKKQNFNFEGLL